MFSQKKWYFPEKEVFWQEADICRNAEFEKCRGKRVKKITNTFPWDYYFLHLFFPMLFAHYPIFTDLFLPKKKYEYLLPGSHNEKFAQLMVHFHWPRSPWRLAKKDGSFVNRDEQEKRKLLQRNHYIKPLQRSHCQMTLFFLFFNSSLFVSRKNSNNLVSLW